tara:strand:- start:77 stop:244 length:168 start_codon:yes stop_codon:yes gene_type:complete
LQEQVVEVVAMIVDHIVVEQVELEAVVLVQMIMLQEEQELQTLAVAVVEMDQLMV